MGRQGLRSVDFGSPPAREMEDACLLVRWLHWLGETEPVYLPLLGA